MDEHEKKLLASLVEISACLKPYDAQWAANWQNASVKAQQLFADANEVKTKYDFVTGIQGYYGGMGSFNDIEIPSKCQPLKTALYDSLKAVRRNYWKQLGREWHDYSQFQLLPNGTKVKLVVGEVIYVRSEDDQAVVPNEPEENDKVWTIVRCDGPDLTNMPTYMIRSDNHFRSARQEALAVVPEKKSLIKRLLNW